jgi:hypothetical protein
MGTRLPVSLAERVGAGAEGYDWAAAAAPGSLADQSAQWAIDTFPSTGVGTGSSSTWRLPAETGQRS